MRVLDELLFAATAVVSFASCSRIVMLVTVSIDMAELSGMCQLCYWQYLCCLDLISVWYFNE